MKGNKQIADKLNAVAYVWLCLQKRRTAGAQASTNPADGGAVMLVNCELLLITDSNCNWVTVSYHAENN
jgi:hypothetical protein